MEIDCNHQHDTCVMGIDGYIYINTLDLVDAFTYMFFQPHDGDDDPN